MIREIVMYGSKILRRVAAPVATIDSEIAGLVKDLYDTLAEADGVGLAAPQIGVLRRVIIVDVSGAEPGVAPIALVNPVIDIGQGLATAEEGCLSIPEVYGDVQRYTNIEVSALDVNGKPFKISADGFFARVLQHEIDHLEGKLFIDHMPPLKRTLLRGPLKRIKVEGEAWDKRNAVS